MRRTYQELINENLSRGELASCGCTPMFHRMNRYYGYGYASYFDDLAMKAMSFWKLKKGGKYKIRSNPHSPSGSDLILSGTLRDVLAKMFAIKMDAQARSDYSFHVNTERCFESCVDSDGFMERGDDEPAWFGDDGNRCKTPLAGAVYMHGVLFVFSDIETFTAGVELTRSTTTEGRYLNQIGSHCRGPFKNNY